VNISLFQLNFKPKTDDDQDAKDMLK